MGTVKVRFSEDALEQIRQIVREELGRAGMGSGPGVGPGSGISSLTPGQPQRGSKEWDQAWEEVCTAIWGKTVPNTGSNPPTYRQLRLILHLLETSSLSPQERRELPDPSQLSKGAVSMVIDMLRTPVAESKIANPQEDLDDLPF